MYIYMHKIFKPISASEKLLIWTCKLLLFIIFYGAYAVHNILICYKKT